MGAWNSFYALRDIFAALLDGVPMEPGTGGVLFYRCAPARCTFFCRAKA
jgi:hypothetical protein